MRDLTVALFGEAEKGAFNTLYYIQTLPQLNESLGERAHDSAGISLAIQMILNQTPVIYVRVAEEGYSLKDYFVGLKLLEEDYSINSLGAIAMPGVGDPILIDECVQVCEKKQCILLSGERDLYDYLTHLES